MLQLTSRRPRAYQVAAPGMAGDILLVDGDQPGLADELRARAGRADAAPTIHVRDSATNARDFEIHRPLTYPKLVAVLDRVTVTALRFVPELVIGDASVSTAAIESLRHNSSAVAKRGCLALVVDDNLVLRKSLEIELNLFGIEVHFAESGEQAMNMAGQNLYDLIFLDVILPGRDGYYICKNLRARADKRYKSTPIIMLTGKNSTIDRIKGTMAGCSFYLTKPAKPETLHETLCRCLPGLDNPGGAMLGRVNRPRASGD
jgi:twitching motility two-component system response regulator PilG